MQRGTAPEIACFGARGDGKTQAALWAMILHAAEHHAHGYPLPTVWLGIRDTFANHKLSTHQSLSEPFWEGRWQLVDGGHIARFVVAGICFVELRLVGVDSYDDAERARTQCHGAWVDEAAPAMGVAQGVSSVVWGMATSSARLETHAQVAMLTSNYSTVEHWAAQRFHFSPQPGTLCYRIPPGERASTAYREKLATAYATQPGLLKRLVYGQFGSVVLGKLVARNFNADIHVAAGRHLEPERDRPLWIGIDGGHTPTAIIGQRCGNEIRILAAMTSEEYGTRQHMEYNVLPWLGEHAPWLVNGSANQDWLHVRYDPSMDTDEQADIEANPIRLMRRMLPGLYLPGPVSWPGRLEPMHTAFGTMAPLIQIDPSCQSLITALNTAWIYPEHVDGRLKKDIPKKPNHPHEDLGDALCYLLAGMAPLAVRNPQPQRHAHSALTPRPDAWAPRAMPRSAVTGSGARWSW